VACETLVSTGLWFVAGEITTKALVDFPEVVRRTVTEIGYVGDSKGFDAHNCAVITAIDRQSPDMPRGGPGAEDKQGRAIRDDVRLRLRRHEGTDAMPISYAHKICARLTEAREKRALPWLRPDGKSQVTVRYVDGLPREVTTVVCSTQHSRTSGGRPSRKA